jgi:magnesium transporter
MPPSSAFLGPDFLITLPNVELLPVTRLFRRCQEDGTRPDPVREGSGYLLYHVLDDLFDYCFPILDKIGHKPTRSRTRCWAGGRRPRHLERETGVISYLQDHQARALHAARVGAHAAVSAAGPRGLRRDIVDAAERIWDLLDNTRRSSGARTNGR